MPRQTPPPDIDDDACEEVEICGTCGDPEDDCCCSYCEGCDERFEECNGCMLGFCSMCEGCCDCEECPSCSNIVYSGGERLDNCCCDCGECHDCCCCEDEEENGNRCYSTDPLRVLGFSAITDDFDAMRWRRCKPIKALHLQRFGIEIEKTSHSHDDDFKMNTHVADRLSCHGMLDSRISGYSVACNDASLEGSSPAESKTPPLTFADHQLCHYGYMMLGQGWSREIWLEHMEYYKSLTPFKQFNLFRQQYFDGGMDNRWQKNAKAWSNNSCGMHVNVSDTMTTQATLYKVFLYIVKSHPNDMKFIGGRSTTEHYCHTHHDKQVWCDVSDRYLDTCHINYVQQVNVYSKHPQAQCRKHDAMSRRSWHGWEMRLFRSSTNPLRILGNMQMAQLLCDYFQYVPYGDIERTGLGPIVRHAVFNRRQFPYAHGNFARQSELANMVRLFGTHLRESRRNSKRK